MTDLYLYQTLHLRAGRPRSTAAHVAVLDSASRRLFGRAYTPDIPALEARIAAAARAERYPSAVSGFVRVELTAAGEERIIPAGISLYDGYALRSLTPEAAIVQYDNPFTDAPTSAREAAAQLAQRQAEAAGAGVALRAASSAQGAPGRARNLLSACGGARPAPLRRPLRRSAGPAHAPARLAALALPQQAGGHRSAAAAASTTPSRPPEPRTQR